MGRSTPAAASAAAAPAAELPAVAAADAADVDDVVVVAKADVESANAPTEDDDEAEKGEGSVNDLIILCFTHSSFPPFDARSLRGLWSKHKHINVSPNP